jgi:hypothetical protein
MVCACRYLREVRNHDHLVVVGKPAQAVPDPEGHRAADAGVDLIEHQRRDAVEAGKNGLEREHDAG